MSYLSSTTFLLFSFFILKEHHYTTKLGRRATSYFHIIHLRNTSPPIHFSLNQNEEEGNFLPRHGYQNLQESSVLSKLDSSSLWDFDTTTQLKKNHSPMQLIAGCPERLDVVCIYSLPSTYNASLLISIKFYLTTNFQASLQTKPLCETPPNDSARITFPPCCAYGSFTKS